MFERHNKHFSFLKTIAEAVEPVAQARLAAGIVFKRSLISIGWNQNKTDPFQKRFGSNHECIYTHAEIHAIKNALRHLTPQEISKACLYVCRMKYTGDNKSQMIQGLAKPCAGCQRAIATFNIRNVFYTLDQQGFVAL